MATQESRPEQALTDLHIAGTLDDIQTAQLLDHAWRVRSMFLTVLSDVAPLRARRARCLVVLTMPIQARELKATLPAAHCTKPTLTAQSQRGR
jgi:hypothetical protein